jgi:hypothetical protein
MQCYENGVALRHGRHYPWEDGRPGTCLGQERPDQSVAALGYSIKTRASPSCLHLVQVQVLFDCPADFKSGISLVENERTRIGRCNFRPNIVPMPFGKIHASIRFEIWAEQNLQKTDEVVLEATTNTWDVYDMIVSLVRRG